MKFFVVFALCVAAATANVISPIVVNDEAAEIQQIMDAINHPSTDPATAALLEQMLNEVLGLTKPEPIDVGPAIVEGDYESISVGPAIVEEVVPAPVIPEINNSPLVQIIINVKPGSGNPVVVEGMPEVAPTPVLVEEKPEVEPTPVIVVEKPEIEPTPVIVEEKPVAPEPVIVAPVVIPEPVITLPDILN
ncbi:36.4 kDa proline-rich protein-like [Vanessa atalanta]|uniref:36.4 kDa proline-rich protein-like n=1 Tax=Vanessa atalanta TaxID=42275 RepID=UPI001FCE156D|nr:36.4 kDa proline-rich protein-like [Vanessa atalanta]